MILINSLKEISCRLGSQNSQALTFYASRTATVQNLEQSKISLSFSTPCSTNIIRTITTVINTLITFYWLLLILGILEALFPIGCLLAPLLGLLLIGPTAKN